jgi:hypothetical protein
MRLHAIIRKGTAAWAFGLLLWSGLVAPWLEREPATRVTIESRHDQRCTPSHDHGLCIQLQHARALPQQFAVQLAAATTKAEQKPSQLFSTPSLLSFSHLHARAPPQL